MGFSQPVWIYVGIAACAGVLLLYRVVQRRRQAALQRFVSAPLLGRLTVNLSSRRRRLKGLLLLSALLLLFIALARPYHGHSWVEVKRRGIDMLFALFGTRLARSLVARINPLWMGRLFEHARTHWKVLTGKIKRDGLHA